MTNPSANYFGHPLRERSELLSDPATRDFLRTTLAAILNSAGTPSADIAHSVEILLSTPREIGKEDEYARALFQNLLRVAPLKGRDRMLLARIQKLHSLFRAFMTGGAILDFGCGDGRLGASFEGPGQQVCYTDVAEARYSNTGVFHAITDDVGCNYDADTFGNVILSSVLHHCAYPDRSLDEAMRVLRPGGRLLIVESTYGAERTDLPVGASALDAQFIALTEQEQFDAMCFLDVFCNYYAFSSEEKLMTYPVPCNFRMLDDWDREAARTGLRVVYFERLGLDHAIAPLFHILLVLEK